MFGTVNHQPLAEGLLYSPLALRWFVYYQRSCTSAVTFVSVQRQSRHAFDSARIIQRALFGTAVVSHLQLRLRPYNDSHTVP